jgi:hypothetical protein
MPAWQSIDQHRYYTDEHFVYWEPHGLVQAAHAQTLVDLLEQAGARFNEVCGLLDQRGTTTVTTEARQVCVAYLRTQPKLRLALVNSSTTMRGLVTLTLAAFRILTPNRLHYQMFVDPTEAMAWLNTFRARGDLLTRG